MSDRNGNGESNPTDSARKRAFGKFWHRTGLKPFGPDFHDSLVNVMRASPKVACLTERVWAWQRWRSWCNSSEYAISDWKGGYPLDQTDCTLDIWWLKHGMSAEWVAGAPRELRADWRRRKEVQHFKPNVNGAFATIEARGDLRFESGKSYSVVSPPADKSPSAVVGSNNRYLTDKDFLAWRAVARSDNHQQFLVVRSAFYEARKIARSDYREWLSLATGRTASPTEGDVIRPNPSGNGREPSAAAVSSEPRTNAAAALTPILEAFAPYGGITDSRARRLLKDCGGATPVEVGDKAREIAGSIKGPGRKNVVGILLTQLPEFFHSEAALAQWLRQREQSADESTAEETERAERRAQLRALIEEEEEKAEGAGS